MEYYSESNRPAIIDTPAGSEFSTNYIEKIDQDGKKQLVEAGKTNIYERIQAAKENSLIKNIIERYQIDINRPSNIQEGIGVDLTQMPDNFIDYYNMMQELKAQFEQEPSSIRKEFNNSFEEYLAGANNGKLAKLYNKGQNLDKNGSRTAENQSDIEKQVAEAQARLEALKAAQGGSNE